MSFISLILAINLNFLIPSSLQPNIVVELKSLEIIIQDNLLNSDWKSWLESMKVLQKKGKKQNENEMKIIFKRHSARSELLFWESWDHLVQTYELTYGLTYG